MNVKAIPDGYHSLTPYMGIDKAGEAIEFYKKAFGATQVMRLDMPDGRVGHAELRIGDSSLMLGTPCDQMALRNPDEHTSIGLHLYVEDVDTVYKNALDAGAETEGTMTVKDQFYGDRSGNLIDPFGHKWVIATHIEDISYETLQKRSDEMMKQQDNT